MDIPSLEEIKVALLAARDTAEYNIGSPRALDHLLCHVVMLIDAIAQPPSNPDSEYSRKAGDA